MRSASALTLLLAVTGTLALAQAAPKAVDPKIAALLEDLRKTRAPQQAAISPDGTTVAWTARSTTETALYLSSANGITIKDRLIEVAPKTVNCANTLPVWSPDGNTLAFISNCTEEANGQTQLFLWNKGTGKVRQLTHMTGSIEAPAWSPDGRSIAFLYVENATRTAGALDAMKPPAGVIGEDGVEVQRVYGVSSTSGNGQWLTPTNLHVYEFNWSQGGDIAFVAAQPPGENTWWIAKLYTRRLGAIAQCMDIAEGCDYNGPPTRDASVVLDPVTVSGPLHNLQIAVPRYSPDGTQIAFIGGLMSDQGATGGDIYLIPSTGGTPKNLTPNRPASPVFLHWVDNAKLGFTEHLGGSSRIAVLDITSGQDIPGVGLTLPESIGAGALAMSVSTSRSSRAVAFIRSSFNRAPEVWAGDLDNLHQISHLNDALKPSWGKTEDITWSSNQPTGNFKVQGWLLYPANYDPSKKYPLLTFVHGGPSSAVVPRWPGAGYGEAPFSAMGYFVFMPNPRGSYGQGEAFTQANVKDFGYGDLHDIEAGIDTLEKRLPIDRDREALTGWSYGGFMTMFAVTQTTRFHAAVAGAGISNWKSYYGENSIDQWMTPFFGASVYDDPAVYAKSSAIEFIKKVKTPTLVVVGDRDGECPAPQSYEFWHALRAEGVKTQLVVYPNEGHAFRDPAHRADVLTRALDWFANEMPAK